MFLALQLLDPLRLSLTPNSQSVRPHQGVSDELSMLVDVAVSLFNQYSSWEEFVSKSCHTCAIAPDVKHIDHPAAIILHQYKKSGVPVIMKTVNWPATKIDSTINRGPHKSPLKELLFLWQEFAAMMRKGQWTVLPASMAQKLKGMRISPVGIGPQRDRGPRTIIVEVFMYYCTNKKPGWIMYAQSEIFEIHDYTQFTTVKESDSCRITVALVQKVGRPPLKLVQSKVPFLLLLLLVCKD
jgi:hypothetical protein